ncbi:Methyltransferase CmcJ [Colletotrichum higginsianum IMI 349063]|uniref:Methyltransferase CmcJ n=1 Tax=Colletotrichum higginsianum (strain IMI 349063) TaxID=759273 RepID=A0A1B7XWN7_COLHI|nr:Methyltransferase CmcJ [Colletotrichum higginsianum IMI 349063]OBR04183.1 Methyltransferase CmcJ [Colletotrichum higginsianum IMI 349063]
MITSMRHRNARLVYTKYRELFRTERPYRILSTFGGSKCHGPDTNLRFGQEETEIITNIRGSEASFTLDQYGFEYVNSPTHFEDWEDRRMVEERYLPEIEKLLLETIEGAHEVFIFDWRTSLPWGFSSVSGS